MQHLVTHASVRLYPPEGEDSQWRALHLLAKASFRLSQKAAFVSVYFKGGGHVNECAATCASKFKIGQSEARLVIDALVSSGILVDSTDTSHRNCCRIIKHWHERGWIESVDHYLLTYDYPFLNYDSRTASIEDRARMDSYRSNEIEPARHKKSRPSHLERMHCEPIGQALRVLDQPLDDFYGDNSPSPILSAEILSRIAVISFGVLRTRSVSHRPDVPPLLRKTSPSGGARHPTDAYIVVLSVEKMTPGIYEYSVAENALVFLLPLPDMTELQARFEGPLRARFDVSAIVVLTSVFERNMFRYREPRTFRTIFMDAGHVAATIEITAKSMGVNAYVQHGIDDAWFEALVGINPLEEAAILGVALG